MTAFIVKMLASRGAVAHLPWRSNRPSTAAFRCARGLDLLRTHGSFDKMGGTVEANESLVDGLVATISPKSRPCMTPLWFVVDRGELYITTGTKTWAGRNVSRRPMSGTSI